jgi:hypothetical protein
LKNNVTVPARRSAFRHAGVSVFKVPGKKSISVHEKVIPDDIKVTGFGLDCQ